MLPNSPPRLLILLLALTAGALVFLGLFGLSRPVEAARAFGLPLLDARDADYVRIKAARDLASGLALAVLLAMRAWRAVGAFLLVSALIPGMDCLLSLLNPQGRPLYALMVHGLTAVWVVAAGGLLLRRGGAGPLAGPRGTVAGAEASRGLVPSGGGV